MGWDVVQIGLRHNLPVHDPFATAKEVAKRMNRNIRLVCRNEYEYDIEKMTQDKDGNWIDIECATWHKMVDEGVNKYPIFFKEEQDKFRSEIERLASMQYQGKRFPYIITEEEMEQLAKDEDENK